ncbi:glucosamine 6-phosphate N-acetyltransferase-like protein [Zychaea mexicana]|uniref:glucosamine 6-phosphate N-acetyltransferase-like protein n=1 Tax=Zychaea mexicana TaxID=64656 RepID=UPI0022FDDE3F|nr:glucosamine 6-phosphate N-acetyltransferase-like protein [Zychaea mexicana]KAI9470469.1 glucosamine 6-phosphate N-acetyltransferase-like protein [Zychaea mexicana]
MTNSPFLTEGDDPQLFSSKLISSEVQEALPDGYTLRPLKRDDYSKGFFEVLGQLSVTGEVSQQVFEERFDLMKRMGCYFVVCVEAVDEIVACATLIVEHKFLHECGQAGHIEDVVVSDTQRGKKLGIRLIDQLKHMAQALGCYKVLLNCKEHNVPFYEKCSLSTAQVQMTRYFDRD